MNVDISAEDLPNVISLELLDERFVVAGRRETKSRITSAMARRILDPSARIDCEAVDGCTNEATAVGVHGPLAGAMVCDLHAQ